MAKHNTNEETFAELFKLHMKGGNIDGFKKRYPTLYKMVIVPAMDIAFAKGFLSKKGK